MPIRDLIKKSIIHNSQIIDFIFQNEEEILRIKDYWENKEIIGASISEENIHLYIVDDEGQHYSDLLSFEELLDFCENNNIVSKDNWHQTQYIIDVPNEKSEVYLHYKAFDMWKCLWETQEMFRQFLKYTSVNETEETIEAVENLRQKFFEILDDHKVNLEEVD